MKNNLSVSGRLRSDGGAPFAYLALAGFVTIICLTCFIFRSPAHWAQGTLGQRTELVRKSDARFLTGSSTYGNDEYSYVAMAEAPFSHDYLVRRSPFSYRVVVPSAVWVLTHMGLSIFGGFSVMALIGCLLACSSIYMILIDMGINKWVATWSSSMFMLLPPVLDTLVDPARVDPLAWGCMFFSWWAWRRSRYVLTCIALMIGILTHETAALIIPCILLDAIAFRERKIMPAVVVSVAGVVPTLISMAAIGKSSSKVPLVHYVHTVALSQFHLIEHGKGIIDITVFSFGMVIFMFPFAWKAFRDPRILVLAPIVFLSLCLIPISSDFGRVIVPSALVSLVAAPMVLQRFARQAMLAIVTWLAAGATALIRQTGLFRWLGSGIADSVVVVLCATVLTLAFQNRRGGEDAAGNAAAGRREAGAVTSST